MQIIHSERVKAHSFCTVLSTGSGTGQTSIKNLCSFAKPESVGVWRDRKYRSKVIREQAGTWLMNKVFAMKSMKTGVQLLRIQVNQMGSGPAYDLSIWKGEKRKFRASLLTRLAVSVSSGFNCENLNE